jgi:serine/threonine protein kinase
MVGQTVSHYKILEKLGEGHIATVYKAQDLNLDRPVVLKFLRPDLLPDESMKNRFLREVKITSGLDHPNICSCHGLDHTDQGQLFICMAYYEGESLKQILQRGPLPFDQAIDIASQIARGLAKVHHKAIIHRNIKPNNVFVTLDGIVKVLDFGLAKLTGPGGDEFKSTAGGGLVPAASQSSARAPVSLGTPAYMSPEQLGASKVDHRTDIWSLGVLMYEMTTGRRPFQADTPETLVYAITQADPPPMSNFRQMVPPKWEQIVKRALAKGAYQRYQRVEDLLKDLHSITLGPGFHGVPQGLSGVDAEESSAEKLHMAYVLFTDIVAYSTLPMDIQTRLISTLTSIVQGASAFENAQRGDQLTLLPTGDGMALVFFGDPIAPVHCAVEISRALRDHPELMLRMGIHTGPVYHTVDINKARNVAGGGINLAQRVMECGDAGHILVSKTVADVLAQLSDWREHLHDLGVQEVKHGVPVHIFNLWSSDFGNSQIPQKVRPHYPQKSKLGSARRTAAGILSRLGDWLR